MNVAVAALTQHFEIQRVIRTAVSYGYAVMHLKAFGGAAADTAMVVSGKDSGASRLSAWTVPCLR